MDSFFASIGYGNFIIVLGVLIFVHEMGHYLVARWCGVKVEVFSIGFGPELFGRTDSAGTRWKVSLFPLGGYVKMFGEGSATVEEHQRHDDSLDEEKRAVSFAHKTVGQRSAIVAAGPLANFLLAVVVFFALFISFGKPNYPDFHESGIARVVEGSAAAEAGFEVGDRILAVNGAEVGAFGDLVRIVTESEGRPLTFDILRDGEPVNITAAPRQEQVQTADGKEATVYRLGIGAPGLRYEQLPPVTAAVEAVSYTGTVTVETFKGVIGLISGQGSLDDAGGPVRIAQMSKDVGEIGLVAVLGFVAVLSINLGLLNLFPIPVLDGGHLVFYAFEAVLGRPVDARIQEVSLRIGLSLLLGIMVLFTVNDIMSS